MEVCFADVGQGSASIILLGQGRAILVDCGPRGGQTVVALLDYFRVKTIVRLIVTHNHADHSSGAIPVIDAFPGRVKQVWFLLDSSLEGSIFWSRIQEELQAGRIKDKDLYRLEYRNQPTTVYQDGDVELQVLSPNFVQNVQAMKESDPNATSGVLVLKKGRRTRVVFSGDSVISQWRSIHERYGRKIRCDFLTVPHHGGVMWESRKDGETEPDYTTRLTADLEWLYSDVLEAHYAIFSVGTANTYNHPRKEVVEAIRRSRCVVFCTQMTGRCSTNLELQRQRSLPFDLPMQSSTSPRSTESGASSDVPCGGTLVVDFTSASIRSGWLAQHQRFVMGLQSNPLCRLNDWDSLVRILFS